MEIEFKETKQVYNIYIKIKLHGGEIVKVVLLIILLLIALASYVYYAPANRRLRELQNTYRCFQMPRYEHIYYLKSKKSFDTMHNVIINVQHYVDIA